MQTVEIVKALRLCAIDDCEKCNGVRYDDKMRCCTEALNLSAADRLDGKRDGHLVKSSHWKMYETRLFMNGKHTGNSASPKKEENDGQG